MTPGPHASTRATDAIARAASNPKGPLEERRERYRAVKAKRRARNKRARTARRTNR